MDGRVLDADAVKKLADLESREVLLAKMAGALQANLSRAVYLFAAPLNQAARALGALERAATENPSLIGGAGSAPAIDQAQDTADDSSAPQAAAAADTTDAASAATE
jgi:large subunit ribosomal protein L10